MKDSGNVRHAGRSAAPTPADWRVELAQAYRSPLALLEDLGLEPGQVDYFDPGTESFAFRVTRAFAARMRHGDADDPLLRQVLPRRAENEAAAGFGPDPLGEFGLGDHGGLLRKYAGRALLITTGACAIHCRYCFRRNFPYGSRLGRDALDQALAGLAADPSVHEIILSGGDPLVLDDDTLNGFVAALNDIPHLRTVRIHSRVPVVLPNRMHDGLLKRLAAQRLHCVLVVHVNHAQEIDTATRAALRRARAAGVTLLNQGVLLRRVNDSAAAQVALSETLFDAGVLPYYMHQLDPVSGAAHFAVDDRQARALENAMRGALPGYLVPRFVREVPGAPSKLPLDDARASASRPVAPA